MVNRLRREGVGGHLVQQGLVLLHVLGLQQLHLAVELTLHLQELHLQVLQRMHTPAHLGRQPGREGGRGTEADLRSLLPSSHSPPHIVLPTLPSSHSPPHTAFPTLPSSHCLPHTPLLTLPSPHFPPHCLTLVAWLY